ncbi:MAG TPA: polyhydroxyalkanoate synthesis regulator DNA-binding domain-containing protein [Terriglobales bacterium]|jgi:polyhydroxyalkanoate synthesis repressor PhaR|nr:polyhydroxyalkanoate synthesis regulator DNA-binding domain-containing protein [Terriglobales bacterium]
MRVATQHKDKSSTIVIKKYGNRRLYDTSASQYVNLDEIARLVRKGRDVRVVDAKTGEDLTRVTLTQIITEDAKDAPAGLPLELLRQLIVASDRTSQEFIMWYLKSAFDAYQAVQDTVQDRLGAVQSAIMSPVESVRRFLGSVPQQTSGLGRNESELEVLQERIAELEKRIPKTRSRNAARNGRAKRK